MKLTGIDIFSGAGGLSLGAEMAGIKMMYAIEIDKSAAATYKRNHPRARKVFTNDIKDVDPSLVSSEKGSLFIIMGGPPCQGFSMSNTRSRNMENPKNHLFTEFLRFVDALMPEWFVLENVWGLTKMENGKTENMIEECFRRLGYEVSSQILWASDYGVPQCRNRFFMVGNKSGIKFEKPKPMKDKITVEEAIGDLPLLENGEQLEEAPYRLPLSEASAYARQMRVNSQVSRQNLVSKNNDLVLQRYKYIKQGQNWRAIPEELMSNYADKKRCHSGIYKRLVADKPSVVISQYRKNMLIHPYQDRGLSVREAARLQSFPDDYIFEGPLSFIQQQIGNAVPPLLAKAVFSQIIKQTKEHEHRQSKHT